MLFTNYIFFSNSYAIYDVSLLQTVEQLACGFYRDCLLLANHLFVKFLYRSFLQFINAMQ